MPTCLACGTPLERAGCPRCLRDLMPGGGPVRQERYGQLGPPVPNVNHILHLILCVITGGLWLLVYVPILLRQNKVLRAR